MTRSVTYVEIDIDFCELTYGTAPCTAAIGTTGTQRCFNTFATCQDTANYDRGSKTLRYTLATEADGRSGIAAIPSITSVRHSPGRVRIAEDLGERASVRISFEDHRHSDLDLDPYVDTRTYDPLTQGSYWGRFVARNRYMVGRPLRVYYGTAGQALADMEERHYVIEAVSGPDLNGNVTVTAKDPLRLADGDQAQAPVASTGRLSADISDTDTSITLEPAGIGDTEYNGVDWVAINDEICEVTGRTDDTLTIVRGQLGTEADSHQTGDTVQVVLEYTSQAPNLILADLLTTYANVPSSYIDSAVWAQNDTLYIGRNFGGYVAEPTAVRELIAELLEQVGASMWWEETTQQIRYEPLRVISSPPALTADKIVADSFSTRAQPDKRISQVWTYYGKINPLEPEDEPRNYRAVAVDIDATSESDNEYGRPSIRKIFSRWVSATARSAAQEVNAKLLSRRRDPPRQFAFDVARYTDSDYLVGDALSVSAWPLQTADGSDASVPVLVTSVGAEWDRLSITAEEFTFTAQDAPGGGASGGGGLNPVRGIDIVTDTLDVNLRSSYDTDYPDPDDILQTITSVDAGTDTITLAGHGYADGARIVFFGADLPAPLVEGTTYYVVNAATDTFEVSATSGGAAIDLTDAGTGTRQVRFVIDVPVVVDPGVIVGSSGASTPAMDVGTWPDGVDITLTVRTGAYVVGAGGDGGPPGIGAFGQGEAGGTGLYTRRAITVDNAGTIAGGGGGGGGSFTLTPGSRNAGGGGGAGRTAGSGGLFAEDGTLTTGGAGGIGLGAAADGGDGGALGTAGQTSTSFGGAAGNAIDGDSFVTISGSGSVIGPQIN